MTPEHWQRMKELHDAALERDASHRAAFLAQACKGDETLLREVASLLAQESGTEDFLRELAVEVPKMLSEEQTQSLIGLQLDSYRVVSLLGVGGMGEVYEARDTNLERSVAIKVLPAEFVNNPERLARFQREAKLLASLNHPNIATIHGLEQSDGRHYLVMEFVPGQTLAERIGKGALGIQEALKVAAQITDALEAAHGKGVIHRDLKPANVKVTPEGRVKVLDFGLAKAFGGDGSRDLSTATTLSEEGRVMGTPAYMSPEQARGEPVDKRTDIWAFGCVLFELLTGTRAFPGKTASDSIAAVLSRDPDWQALPAATPASVRGLLRRCLQKDPQYRLRDIGDARIELGEALSSQHGSDAATQAPAFSRRAITVGLSALFAAAVVGIVAWNLKPSSSSVPMPVSRSVIDLPAGQELAGLSYGLDMAISPDGSLIAYVARGGGKQQIYLRPMDSLQANPIPGTENGIEPFFSPDGQWLGFFADDELKKISVSGGATTTIADLTVPGGAGGESWNAQGTIVFGCIRTPLQQVSDTGGTPQSITHLEKGEVGHFAPTLLPGGAAVLFTACNGSGTGLGGMKVAMQKLPNGEIRDLIPSGTQPHYVSAGYLVYAEAGNLMAARFDPRRLAMTSAAVPVVEGILERGDEALADFAISSTGSLVYVPGFSRSQTNFVWVDRNGKEQQVSAPPHNYVLPRISPDGKRVTAGIEEADSQIWVYDFARDTLTRLTFQGDTNVDPIWTPDGQRIVFKGARNRLFWQPADGSGGAVELTSGQLGSNNIPGSWSPDGRDLVFTLDNPTGRNIWILPLKDGKPHPLLPSPARYETAPRLSPDGRWVAYTSNESGTFEIYVRPYSGSAGKWQVSNDGGTEPVWNPKGHELFYRDGQKMMAVDYTGLPTFSAGRPHELFEGPYVETPRSFPDYDVSPDGQRFLMLKPVGQEQTRSQIVVVQNWFEELKQKVPAEKN